MTQPTSPLAIPLTKAPSRPCSRSMSRATLGDISMLIDSGSDRRRYIVETAKPCH